MDATIIDAGTGNLHSVENALASLGFDVVVTADPHALKQAGRVVLPGVGAFGAFMQGLRSRGLDEAVREIVQRGDPLLGICVGMQALFDLSEEMGAHAGLGLIPGRVVRFAPLPGRKVPHTGWNRLGVVIKQPLFAGLPDESYAYFNHSYYCSPETAEVVSAWADYDGDFCAAVQSGNLLGVQFHPEKSQSVGKTILANFMRM